MIEEDSREVKKLIEKIRYIIKGKHPVIIMPALSFILADLFLHFKGTEKQFFDNISQDFHEFMKLPRGH